MKRRTTVSAVLLLACFIQRGEGQVVALQTADPSCPDDSGNIYVDCGNGTVTDNRTGLVWLKNAMCVVGGVDWIEATEFTAGLADVPATSAASSDDCGLSDGSSPGEWRLPSVSEWEEMVVDAVALGCIEASLGGPSITNDSGSDCLQEGPSSFIGATPLPYWSSMLQQSDPSNAYRMSLAFGDADLSAKTSAGPRFWPVRGGQ